MLCTRSPKSHSALRFYKPRQSGVALVTVLFLFAIVVVVLSSLVTLTQANINRASHYFASEQAWLLCLSGEELARQLLIEDLKKGNQIDYAHEKWAESGLGMSVDGGYFEVSIEDAQGKFNINNVIKAGKEDPVMKAALVSFFDLSLDDNDLATQIAGQAIDWMDSDKTGGTEEFDYLNEKVPYRPPNLPVSSPSEIRWLKDMDADKYHLLRGQMNSDMVSLPSGTKININTISPVTLASLAGISLTAAQSAVDGIRANKLGNSNIQTALTFLPPAARKNFISYLAIKTDYFEVKVRAKYADQYVFLKTLIKRDSTANGGKGELEIISRDRGGRFLFSFSKDYNDGSKNQDYSIDI